ncbi:MAG TPA: restriction endonuclease subunit S [Candidatus Rifleibacterium sp.]|mgnify:CR=1 FL=1|jgi:type I restriction enzyme S subunit|nr:restriction endonuclease subunit S [Candidatus Rifleibacterium sp.]
MNDASTAPGNANLPIGKLKHASQETGVPGIVTKHSRDVVKAGWKRAKLNRVCEKITDGTHQTPKYFDYGFLFLSSRNVTSGKIDWENVKYIDDKQHVEMQRRVSPRLHDILLAKNGTTGVAAMVDRDVTFDIYVSLALLRPLEGILPKFLLYFINSPLAKEQFNKRLKGIGVPNLHLEEIREVELAYPESEAEQQRIVGILDEAFESIAVAKANAEKNLQNTRALFESYLQSVFTQRGEGWVVKTLGDIAQIKGGKRVPKGYKLLTEPTDYPYLRVADFTDTGTIDMNDLRYISQQVWHEIKNYVIYSTDLYISIAGTIGKTGIIPEDLDGANLTENACRLVFNTGISNRFVYYFTVTPDFIEQAGLNTRTAAQPKLALSRLATIKIGIPPIIEQKSGSSD